MSSKKQIADIENTIVLLEEKIEKLEDEHATMKQMISMQNSLIDNLQMMVKMLTIQPVQSHVVHVGGDEEKASASVTSIEGGSKNHEHVSDNKRTDFLKYRMSRVM